MKLRTGFISNSSSTSFIIQAKTFLVLKIKREVTETLRGMLEKRPYFNDINITDSSPYGSWIGNARIESSEFNADEIGQVGVVDMSFGISEISWDCVDPDAEYSKDEEPPGYYKVTIDSKLYNYNKDFFKEKLKELLTEILLAFDCTDKRDFEITYFQHPVEIFGDGWDGGDPMGEYEYETRMYENEHQFGKLDLYFGESDLDFSLVKKMSDSYEHKFLKEL